MKAVKRKRAKPESRQRERGFSGPAEECDAATTVPKELALNSTAVDDSHSRAVELRIRIIPVTKTGEFCNDVKGSVQKASDTKRVVNAAKRAVGAPPTCIGVADGCLIFRWIAEPDLVAASCENLEGVLAQTACELQRNAARAHPLPLKKAVASPSVLHILGLTPDLNVKNGNSFELLVDGKKVKFPAVDSTWFFEPVEEEASIRCHVNLPITAIRYFGQGDIEIELGLEPVVVSVELGHRLVDWHVMGGVFPSPFFFVGTIFRDSPGAPWRPGQDSRIEPGPKPLI